MRANSKGREVPKSLNGKLFAIEFLKFIGSIINREMTYLTSFFFFNLILTTINNLKFVFVKRLNKESGGKTNIL